MVKDDDDDPSIDRNEEEDNVILSNYSAYPSGTVVMTNKTLIDFVTYC